MARGPSKRSSSGKTFDSTNELARLFCLVIVVDWYENRTYIAGKVGDSARPMIESILGQLNYSKTV